MKIIDEKYYEFISVGVQHLSGMIVEKDKQKSAYHADNRIHIKSIQNFKAVHFGYFKAISRLSE